MRALLIIVVWLCAVGLYAGEIHVAAKAGDVEKVKALLKEHPSLVFSKEEGDTALHLAAAQGHKEVVELLLAKGADLDSTNYSGFTPLRLAVAFDQKDVVELLLGKHADANIAGKDGLTPCACAKVNGKDDLVALLEDSPLKTEAKPAEVTSLIVGTNVVIGPTTVTTRGNIQLTNITSVRVNEDGRILILYAGGGGCYDCDQIPLAFLNAWGITGTDIDGAYAEYTRKHEQAGFFDPVEQMKQQEIATAQARSIRNRQDEQSSSPLRTITYDEAYSLGQTFSSLDPNWNIKSPDERQKELDVFAKEMVQNKGVFPLP